MNRSPEIKELVDSLIKFQKKIGFVEKDSNNPFFKSKYADLAKTWDTARIPLLENGLCITQTTRADAIEGAGAIILETTLMHESGQYISGEILLKPIKNSPQDIGSCITYARRYGLQAILGICPNDDDDGNTASGNTPVPAPIEKPQPKMNPVKTEKIILLSGEDSSYTKDGKTIFGYKFKSSQNKVFICTNKSIVDVIMEHIAKQMDVVYEVDVITRGTNTFINGIKNIIEVGGKDGNNS